MRRTVSVERLRYRAKRHHRSLQDELTAIIDAVVAPPAQTLSAPEFVAEIGKLSLHSRDEVLGHDTPSGP